MLVSSRFSDSRPSLQVYVAKPGREDNGNKPVAHEIHGLYSLPPCDLNDSTTDLSNRVEHETLHKVIAPYGTVGPVLNYPISWVQIHKVTQHTKGGGYGVG